jgi:hypothetical protein
LEIDDNTRQIVHDIGSAINDSIENSSQVARAIERLREAGFEMELTLRLELGLRPHVEGEESEPLNATLELTDEDIRVLQRMKIRFDSE